MQKRPAPAQQVGGFGGRLYSPGVAHQPLPFTTSRGEQFKVGVSLCFEQWYPDHWAKLAQNGTDFYAHLAGEGWYGELGFQQFMANVSRLRCIETRRQAARCANVGLSLFINQMGEFSRKARGTGEAHGRLYPKSNLTFFAQHPYWFQWAVFGTFLMLYLHSVYPFLSFFGRVRKKKQSFSHLKGSVA